MGTTHCSLVPRHFAEGSGYETTFSCILLYHFHKNLWLAAFQDNLQWEITQMWSLVASILELRFSFSVQTGEGHGQVLAGLVPKQDESGVRPHRPPTQSLFSVLGAVYTENRKIPCHVVQPRNCKNEEVPVTVLVAETVLYCSARVCKQLEEVYNGQHPPTKKGKKGKKKRKRPSIVVIGAARSLWKSTIETHSTLLGLPTWQTIAT